MSVKDGGARVTDEVGGHNTVLGVPKDTLEGSLGGFLDGSLDVVVRRSLLSAANEIDDGDIEGRDTEGQTTAKGVREIDRTE